MDPITQAVVGATFAQAAAHKTHLAKAAVIGALAGMAADLDIFIRSSTDPLLALEYHRQFTHSLLFIPIGGLICSAVIYPLLAKRWGLSFSLTLLWCVIGFATHGLLDACTSYGTQLLWPFTDSRIAWNIISVIDPLFTLPLLLLISLAAFFKKRRLSFAAVIVLCSYFTVGLWQQTRGETLTVQLAQQRGHAIETLTVKPSFANIVLWKSVYLFNGDYYIDAIRPGLFQASIWPGPVIAQLDTARDLPWLDLHSQQFADLERFRWFSSGYIALDPVDSNKVVDVRYSTLPQTFKPLWGIELSATAINSQHTVFYTVRNKGDSTSFRQLIEMILN